MKGGFHKAFSAIFDGNITTLIAAAVLYVLGTGSVRGFAETLAIGVVLSMFTCLALSRWISYAFYGIGVRNLKLYGTIKQRKNINFVGKRAVTLTIALIMILSVPAGMLFYKQSKGSIMNFSLDFVGGTATTVDFGEDMTLADLDSKVKPVVTEATGTTDIQFQKITGSTQVVIKTSELDLDKRNALDSALAENFSGVDEGAITAENISSTISGEMRSNAILAVVISVICMLFYIFVRFRDFRFASSAVLALVHDICVVIAYYVWFRASVGSTFIAVMLTILGYSINATIVIFDRIRENLPMMKGESSLAEIVNASITQTLTRSLYSNLTTFITIFVLYLFGVPSIREFALPIMIGLAAGCFSSVFVTGPLWYVMKTRIGKNRVKDIAGLPASAGKTEDAGQKSPAGQPAAPGQGKNRHVKKDRSELSSTKRKKNRYH